MIIVLFYHMNGEGDIQILKKRVYDGSKHLEMRFALSKRH